MSLSLLVRTTVICSGLVLASPAVVSGAENLNPVGGETAIVGQLAGDQSHPHAAIGSLGGFVVWADNSRTTNGLRIKAQRLNSSLIAEGLPFSVGSTPGSKALGLQEKPKVALLENGGAFVVWQGGKPGFQQIYARILRPTGGFVNTVNIRVSAHPKNDQVNPAVVALPNGTVVVVWASAGQDGSYQGIYAQRFSATGGKLGAEFRINQFTPNNQRTPSVATLADGNFVVAWVSELQRSSSGVDIYARKMYATGLPAGDEFPVNTTTNLSANPTVAGSADGGFAVAWSQNNNRVLTAGSNLGIEVGGVSTVRSPLSWDVFARLFDAGGVAKGDAFRLNYYSFGDQFAPTMSSSGNSYVVVWTGFNQLINPANNTRDPWEGVYAQGISSDGTLFSGTDLHVNTTTVSRQVQPTIASDGASRFLAVWTSFCLGPSGATFDLFAQSYLQSSGQ